MPSVSGGFPMSELPVIASSPVAFSTEKLDYFLIPLSALYVDQSGVVKADRWAHYLQYRGIIDPLVSQLQTDGILAAGPAPPRKPAVSATAHTPRPPRICVANTNPTLAAKASTPPASAPAVAVADAHTNLVSP